MKCVWLFEVMFEVGFRGVMSCGLPLTSLSSSLVVTLTDVMSVDDECKPYKGPRPCYVSDSDWMEWSIFLLAKEKVSVEAPRSCAHATLRALFSSVEALGSSEAQGSILIGLPCHQLSFEQQADLERNISNEEIKSAVWDCEMNKSPGPDGFTSELFRRYWKLLRHDIVAAVKYFFASGLFSGIPIDSSLTLSHLFFVNGAIFVVPSGVLKLLESIRRNFFNGMDGSERKMAWISWNKVLASKKYGGLRVSVGIKRLHDDLEVTVAKLKGGAEEEQLGFLLSRIDVLILTNIPDRWVWSLEATCEFSIKFVRQLIDDLILPKEEVATTWVKFMPIKINLFAWIVRLDKLPTWFNLFLKGVDISTIVCPLCHASVEFSFYIFFFCPMAHHLWKKLIRWWELEDIDLTSYDD
ncbi:RNA-directed DNA polymerase, eukaryota [Tanacetum coccineum]